MNLRPFTRKDSLERLGSGLEPTFSLGSLVRSLRHNPRFLRRNCHDIRNCKALWLKAEKVSEIAEGGRMEWIACKYNRGQKDSRLAQRTNLSCRHCSPSSHEHGVSNAHSHVTKIIRKIHHFNDQALITNRNDSTAPKFQRLRTFGRWNLKIMLTVYCWQEEMTCIFTLSAADQ